jgi:putative transposase
MNDESDIRGRSDHLPRLPPENYRGQAYVHWSMTIEDRKTGWLVPIFYYKFRELLTHTAFRFGLCCPIYCCMPDHLHMLSIGIVDACDQRLASRYLRKQLNAVLEKLSHRLQREAHDHVLREEERERSAFENVFEYIARNPESAGLVKENGYRQYPYTDCLMPGYPELKIWQSDYWGRFWRAYMFLREFGLSRDKEEEGPCAPT